MLLLDIMGKEPPLPLPQQLAGWLLERLHIFPGLLDTMD